MNVRLFSILSLAGWCTALSCSAEWSKEGMPDVESYLSFYGGWGTAAGGTVKGTVRDNGFFSAGEEYAFNNRYGRSEFGTGGVRLGVWSNHERYKWLGCAVDASYLRVDASQTSIRGFPVSIAGMVRYPMMVSDRFPSGRTQPYAGIGAVFVWVDLETEAVRPDGTTENVDVVAEGAGIDLHVGWSFKLSKETGIFAEYRYIEARLEGDTEDDDFVFFPDSIVEMETRLSMHQILSGFFVTF